jgi:hypothetical protein
MPTVNRVAKETSADRSHRHIAGVCTTDGNRYTRAAVVRGLRRGERWVTTDGRTQAVIREIDYCPRYRCPATPYITTEPDSTTTNNLENLPECVL